MRARLERCGEGRRGSIRDAERKGGGLDGWRESDRGEKMTGEGAGDGVSAAGRLRD